MRRVRAALFVIAIALALVSALLVSGAETIEAAAERATVVGLGVTLGQGYLLGSPAPAESWSVVAAARPFLARPTDGRQPVSERESEAQVCGTASRNLTSEQVDAVCVAEPDVGGGRSTHPRPPQPSQRTGRIRIV